MPAALDAPRRARRAVGFAGTCLVLAAGAHSLSAGALPDLWLLLVGGLIIGAAAWPLVARERSAVQIAAALAAAQAALHGWFELTAGHGGHGVPPATASPMTMLAAHAAATLAAALWLRRYERRAWLAARRLWVALLLAAWPLVRPPVAAAAPLHALPARPTLPRRPALATASGLRAPPR